MDEQTVWKGGPSQITNISTWLQTAVAAVGFALVLFFVGASDGQAPRIAVLVATALLLLMVLRAGWRWLEVLCFSYEVTTERIRISSGVLSKRMHQLELYRVKDVTFEQPWYLRLWGLANIQLHTSDRSHPDLTIYAVRNALELSEQIRWHIERRRDQKGVRELDV